MKKYTISLVTVIAIFTLLIQKSVVAQSYLDYNFSRDLSIPVRDSSGNLYEYAWAGGMNSCQFSDVDLNLDGIMDLFVFDRCRNKMLTFINGGTQNTIDYTFAPKYERYLQQYPSFTDWVMFKDYNHDDKKDIIAYLGGSMRVYENRSDTILKFQLITIQLLSFYYLGYSNIFVSQVDYPGIEDIDGDKDLDIIAFYQLGVRIHLHKNLGFEHHGLTDTLDYRLAHECWGYFSEHEFSNLLHLNDSFCLSLPYIVKSGNNIIEESDIEKQKKIEKHTGSTMLFLDLNGDGLQDLLLGDVDYSNIISLINGGTPDSTHMISQDIHFPSNTKPIDVKYFPVTNYVDIDNDTVKELLVSPFDPQPFLSENRNSVWLYDNSGYNDAPVFQYQKDNFLQDEMIDMGGCAYPVFFDHNNDSLMDILVGNHGVLDSSYMDSTWLILHSTFRSGLALFENIGTKTSPEFQLITRDYAGISTLYHDSMPIVGIYPAVGDLDNDGDFDMIIGNSDGYLHYYENVATTGSPASFAAPVMNYQNIDVGKFSTPQLVDIDKDGLLDLVIGQKKGNLYFYENTGTLNTPVYTSVTDSFGGVDVTNVNWGYDGYSVPHFFTDTAGELNLFVGSEYGYIEYYNGIDSNLTGDFTKVDSLTFMSDNFSVDSAFLDIFEGTFSRVGIATNDLNDDGFIDLIIGNLAGGLTYYKGVPPPPVVSGINEDNELSELSFLLYPNPAKDKITVQLEDVPKNTDLQISVISTIGKRVINRTVRNRLEFSIDISGLSHGIYILNITSLANNSKDYICLSKKFVVQK